MTSSAESKTFLLVDDDERFRDRLGRALTQRGHRVLHAMDHASALGHVSQCPIDRAIVDLRMPHTNGLHVVRDILAQQPTVSVIVLTGYGSIATAVEAIRLGAHDYLTKPCHADRILAAFEDEPKTPSEELGFAMPSLAQMEREHIERALRECQGNISKTARVLGLHRRTLQYKLAKFPAER